MSRRFDHFLRHGPIRAQGPNLGRIFAVTQESWDLSDDPMAVAPGVTKLASGRTASDGADVARLAAAAFREHGFDKPSGAWWGSDGERFHRFVVHTGRRRWRGKAALVGTGVAGLAAIALVGFLHARGRRRGAES
jgi:hypothetical protein